MSDFFKRNTVRARVRGDGKAERQALVQMHAIDISPSQQEALWERLRAAGYSTEDDNKQVPMVFDLSRSRVTFPDAGMSFSVRGLRVVDEWGHLYFERMTPQQALEQRGALISLMVEQPGALARNLRIPGMQGNFSQHLDSLHSLLEVVRGAEVVLWKNEILEVAQRGSVEAFNNVPLTSSMVPLQPQLWFFERSVGISDQMRRFLDLPDVPGLNMHGLTVSAGIELAGQRRSGLAVAFIFTRDPQEGDTAALLPYLRTLGCQIDKPIPTVMRDVVAPMEFLKTRVATKEVHRAPRHERRRLERSGSKEHLPDVSVIVLRKSEQKGQSQSTGTNPVDWKHQWVVEPHWRQQYYPSQKVHKPVFIERYVKGPDDKPLLIRDRVAVARR